MALPWVCCFLKQDNEELTQVHLMQMNDDELVQEEFEICAQLRYNTAKYIER